MSFTIVMIGISLHILLVLSSDEVNIPGDFIIGGLFHISAEPWARSLHDHFHIQEVEAAIMTVNIINRNESLLKGVRLGLRIRDSKFAPLDETMKLLWPALTATQRSSVSENPDQSPNIGNQSALIAVINTDFRETVIQDVFNSFHVPQITPQITQKDNSSDKMDDENNKRIRAIIDIISKSYWNYISVVIDQAYYGPKDIKYFYKLASERNICIAREEIVASSVAIDFDKIVLNLHKDTSVSVIVCFCERLEKRIFETVEKHNLSERFTFIVSDGTRFLNLTEADTVPAWGSISLRSIPLLSRQFDEYFCHLDGSTSTSPNPWRHKEWIYKSHLSYPGKSRDEYEASFRKHPSLCYLYYKQSPLVSFVIDSIWMIAQALDKTLKNHCPNCRDMDNAGFTKFSTHYLRTELNAFSKGSQSNTFEVLNYQKTENKFIYKSIGTWVANGTILLNEEFQFRDGRKSIESVCSEPCPVGHFQEIITVGAKKGCGWTCLPCYDNQVVTHDQLGCLTCTSGSTPNQARNECVTIEVTYLLWSNPWAIATIILSVFGSFAILYTVYILVKHIDTPVIKSATPALSFLILAGLLLMHWSVYSMIGRPTRTSCTSEHLMPGISFYIIYGSLLTKTSRIVNIFGIKRTGFSAMKYSCMSTNCLLLVTICIIMLRVVATELLLVFHPLKSGPVYPSENQTILTCQPDSILMILPNILDFILLGSCFYYTIRGRKIPESFNETRSIGFGIYITSVIQFLFLIRPYLKFDLIGMYKGILVTGIAWVNWFCLFCPKLYTVIFKPETNKPAVFMAEPSTKSFIGIKSKYISIKSYVYSLTSDASTNMINNSEQTSAAVSVETTVDCNHNSAAQLNNLDKDQNLETSMIEMVPVRETVQLNESTYASSVHSEDTDDEINTVITIYPTLHRSDCGDII